MWPPVQRIYHNVHAPSCKLFALQYRLQARVDGAFDSLVGWRPSSWYEHIGQGTAAGALHFVRLGCMPAGMVGSVALVMGSRLEHTAASTFIRCGLGVGSARATASMLVAGGMTLSLLWLVLSILVGTGERPALTDTDVGAGRAQAAPGTAAAAGLGLPEQPITAQTWAKLRAGDSGPPSSRVTAAIQATVHFGVLGLAEMLLRAAAARDGISPVRAVTLGAAAMGVAVSAEVLRIALATLWLTIFLVASVPLGAMGAAIGLIYALMVQAPTLLSRQQMDDALSGGSEAGFV